MIKKIVLVFISLFYASISVETLTYKGCDSNVVSRLKSLVSNVNVSYDYRFVEGEPIFDVTLNNVPRDVFFVDTKDIYAGSIRKKYYYSNTNNGEITIRDYFGKGGTYKFYVNYNGCNDVYLGSKYYKFPVYNWYYGDKLCQDIPNYSLCQKWVDVNYSYEEFKEKVKEYKDNLNKKEENQKINHNKYLLLDIINFYIKYFYIFLIALVGICTSIIIIKRTKDRFKL